MLNTGKAMFAELPEDQFPVHLTLYRGDTLAWEGHVREPGALRVPGLAGITRCVVELGDGTIYDTDE